MLSTNDDCTDLKQQGLFHQVMLRVSEPKHFDTEILFYYWPFIRISKLPPLTGVVKTSIESMPRKKSHGSAVLVYIVEGAKSYIIYQKVSPSNGMELLS